jgi:hypothetical protein
MSSGGLIQVALGNSKGGWSALSRVGRLILVELKARNDFLNIYWGGLGTITGTIKIGATPCKRRVRLYEANTGILIREIWSADDGNYIFTGLRMDYKYTVSSTDYNNAYNDTIAARITAV